MSWSSWSDFWAMGGYGLYVWGSFIATFALVGAELATLAARRKAALNSARTWLRARREIDDEDQA